MTVSSKVSYWGEWDMGKAHIRHHFMSAGYNTTHFKDYYWHTSYYRGHENDKYVFDYYRTIRTLNDTIQEVREVDTIKVKYVHHLIDYNCQINSFFGEENLKANSSKEYFDESQLNKDFYSAKHLYPDLEKEINRTFDDSTLLISPMPLLGYDRKDRDQIRNLIPPIKYNFDIVSRFKSIRNVVPFKSDIRDKFINPVNILDYTPYKGLYDTYTKNKSYIWKLLDRHVAQNRAVETILKMNKIEYDYFDMDNDKYDTFFGFDHVLPPFNYTHMRNDCSESDDKYKFILKVVDEYLDLRKIKDLRLQGFKEDGIE